MSYSLLFTGHMIDARDRPAPRFPASREGAAGEAILRTLEQSVALRGTEGLRGIAAAACGGDILFQEACRALHISSELYLGIPVDAFQQTSVAFAGADWIARYRRLTRELPVHILRPDATPANAGPKIWEEANRWMLEVALAEGGDRLTLIALWDGGPGSEREMVDAAKAAGAAVELIDVAAL